MSEASCRPDGIFDKNPLIGSWNRDVSIAAAAAHGEWTEGGCDVACNGFHGLPGFDIFRAQFLMIDSHTRRIIGVVPIDLSWFDFANTGITMPEAATGYVGKKIGEAAQELRRAHARWKETKERDERVMGQIHERLVEKMMSEDAEEGPDPGLYANLMAGTEEARKAPEKRWKDRKGHPIIVTDNEE